MEQNQQIIKGDAIQEMQKLSDKSVDMILCDLPYGMTANNWDSIIPLDEMWNQFKRLLKPKGCVVLTGMQPFTSRLVMSNIKWFKYEAIWKKQHATGHLNAKKQVMRIHENILIFSDGQGIYNPQKMGTTAKRRNTNRATTKSTNYGLPEKYYFEFSNGKAYPKSIIAYGSDKEKYHPTQKPVNLFKYLIETYSNEGDTVLDCCIGSGTTAIACIRTDRKCIGIEKEQKYIDITNKRIEDENKIL